MGYLTRTLRDSTGLSETRWESVDPSRNAQVVGSSPTSGSNAVAQHQAPIPRAQP